MPEVPRLMAISDRRALPGGDLTPWLRRMAEAGVDSVQIREKDLSDRELFETARSARAVLGRDTLLLINGRADIAVAAQADGVHLPAAGLPIPPLRRRFGAELLIGRSTHDPAEVEPARRDGADYVTFGPVFPTPSKERYGPPPGLAGLRRACQSGLPVLALGGVTSERLAELAEAGAWGAAAIRLFLEDWDLRELVPRAAGVFR